MAAELKLSYVSGSTLYATIRNAAGNVWYISGQTFEAWGTGGRDADDYDIALTGDAGDLYVGNMDTNISAGVYIVQFYVQAGGSAADGDNTIGAGEIWWSGSAELTGYGMHNTAQADLDIITGSDGVTLATTQGNYAPAVAGDLMGLANDAITSAKYDESTAFPVTSVDTGATRIARTGADSDTLETLSDQLDDVLTLGPGDYATTLTIRTTGGTPIAGVGVWVNTSNTRSGAVAGTLYTDAAGQVVFNLNYATYYIFCTLAGYTFNPASFTSSAGNVAFVKDIGVAVSVGANSNYEESFLTRALATVREMLDEPTVNKKYTDNRIITQLEKSYVHVLGEVNRNSRTPAVGTYSLTVNSGQLAEQQFVLPHNSGNILAVYLEDEFGRKLHQESRGRQNILGRGVWIEGDTLKVQRGGISSESGAGTATLNIEHVPVGVARLHRGTLTLDSDGDAATFGATPHLGVLDTHLQAYLGCTLRILEVDGTTVTGNFMQERTISNYDHETRVATLAVALDPVPTTDDGNIYYEIAPTIHKGLDEIVATYTAYAICLTEGNHKRAAGILKRYQTEIRSVRLTSYYSHLTEATKQRGDSFDVRRYAWGRNQRI
jgi:hypothetical protein